MNTGLLCKGGRERGREGGGRLCDVTVSMHVRGVEELEMTV